MTLYVVHCEQCGVIGQSNIKQRSENKRGKHMEETGHAVIISREKEAVS